MDQTGYDIGQSPETKQHEMSPLFISFIYDKIYDYVV
jgi:hypothetical protein